MATYARLARSHRWTVTARLIPRAGRPVEIVGRTEVAVRNRDEAVIIPSPPPRIFEPDPYVDYGRFLTDEGGILIVYKDIDERLRHILWRLFIWTMAAGVEGQFLYWRSPIHNFWINLVCLLAVGIINWLIVAKPVEIYQKIEVRPDCLILEGTDVFWTRHMGDTPTFREDADGNHVLGGIYGTRFVEYLTARRFDENDRTPEIFAIHLQEAMTKLWSVYRE